MTTAADFFSPRLETFRGYWAQLWGLTPAQRDVLVPRVFDMIRAAENLDRDAQLSIVNDISTELRVAAPQGEMSLEILKCTAHVFAQSDESESEIVAEFSRLDFFDEDVVAGQKRFIQDFFTRLSDEGLGRATTP